MRIDERTDSELVLAARAGDKAAFGLLVERYLLMTRRLAMQMTGNQAIAWELAQEAMLQAYLSLHTLREAARFQSWLYGIVRNVCRSYLRSPKTNIFSLEAMSGGELYDDHCPLDATFDAQSDAQFDPQVVIEQRELSARLEAAIASLSPKNQAAARLFYDEQLSLQEIAEHLGTSVNAIKNRLFQARKQLQAQLGAVYTPAYQPSDSIHNSTNKRRTNMVRISNIHAIETGLTGSYILYLLDAVGERIVQIWVGPHEGAQIAYLLRGLATPRPMTYKFVANLLDKLGAKLQEVRVESIKETTFYAVVKAQNGKTVHELDARPSDALALALHMNSPIYVSEEVMAKAGEALPQPFDEQVWLQKETEHAAEMARLAQSWEQKLKDPSTPDTPVVVQILKQAQAQAQAQNHHYVGTEHLLLALGQDPASNATKVLHALGVEPAQIATTFERRVGHGQVPPLTEPVLVPRVIQVLEIAEEERRALGHPVIGAEHLLLGIVREGEGMAVAILRDLGVEPEQVRVRTLETIASAS